MEYDYKNKQRKSYTLMRASKDITMAVLIIAVGIVLLLGDKFGGHTFRQFIADKDPILRYAFGGMCLLYGGYRLYRGIKQQY